jgi:hypothetical protein
VGGHTPVRALIWNAQRSHARTHVCLTCACDDVVVDCSATVLYVELVVRLSVDRNQRLISHLTSSHHITLRTSAPPARSVTERAPEAPRENRSAAPAHRAYDGGGGVCISPAPVPDIFGHSLFNPPSLPPPPLTLPPLSPPCATVPSNVRVYVVMRLCAVKTGPSVQQYRTFSHPPHHDHDRYSVRSPRCRSNSTRARCRRRRRSTSSHWWRQDDGRHWPWWRMGSR